MTPSSDWKLMTLTRAIESLYRSEVSSGDSPNHSTALTCLAAVAASRCATVMPT